MSQIKFYNDGENWIYTDGVSESEKTALASMCQRIVSGTKVSIKLMANNTYLFHITEVTDIQKSATPGDNYPDLATFKTATSSFFVNASLAGGVKVTESERLALTPVEGMEVYQTDRSSGKYLYNGTKWDKISNLAYLKASNVTSVNPAVHTQFNFSSGVVSSGIKANVGSGRYELYPGVYELMAVQCIADNDAGMGYQFYNDTTSSYVGERGNASDVLGSAGVSSPCFEILECSVDTQIGVRCINDSTTNTATEGNWMKIKQIS